MAYGTRTLNAIKNPLFINTRLIIMNAIALCHRKYSSVILNSITHNLVASLDQQPNWAIKLCFNRLKFYTLRQFKIQFHVQPIRVIPNFYYLKSKELETVVVKSDIELPFSKKLSDEAAVQT